MTLETTVKNAVSKTVSFLQGNTGRDYLLNDLEKRVGHYIKEAPEEKREGLRTKLEEYLDDSREKYQKQLGGVIRKVSAKGTMIGAIANDIYSFLSDAPINYFSGISYGLFGVKTIMEIPALYKYWNKTHDWYGAFDIASHLALKPLRYLIPVVGPALESGAFERMVSRRVRREAEQKFLQYMKRYVPAGETIKERLKEKIGQFVKQPEGAMAGELQPALA